MHFFAFEYLSHDVHYSVGFFEKQVQIETKPIIYGFNLDTTVFKQLGNIICLFFDILAFIGNVGISQMFCRLFRFLFPLVIQTQ